MKYYLCNRVIAVIFSTNPTDDVRSGCKRIAYEIVDFLKALLYHVFKIKNTIVRFLRPFQQ